jgi:hypothetical protein
MIMNVYYLDIIEFKKWKRNLFILKDLFIHIIHFISGLFKKNDYREEERDNLHFFLP